MIGFITDTDSNEIMCGDIFEIVHVNMNYFGRNCYNSDISRFLRWLASSTKGKMFEMTKYMALKKQLRLCQKRKYPLI